METKICTKCGEEKAFIEYYTDISSKSGYRCECKLCSRKMKKISYKKHRKQRLKENSKYYASNKKQCLENFKSYYKKNKEIIRINQSEYAKKNKDKIREQQLKYQKDNEELIKKRSKDYHIKNKDKIHDRNKKWRKENRQLLIDYSIKNKHKKKLTNSYANRLIIKNSNLKTNEVPKELTELKKVQLQLHREIIK